MVCIRRQDFGNFFWVQNFYMSICTKTNVLWVFHRPFWDGMDIILCFDGWKMLKCRWCAFKFQACLGKANKENSKNKCKTWKRVPITWWTLDIHCSEIINLETSFCKIISLLGHEGPIWRIDQIISMFHTLFPLCYCIFHGIITMLRTCSTLLN